jgi:hypothetical protein
MLKQVSRQTQSATANFSSKSKPYRALQTTGAALGWADNCLIAKVYMLSLATLSI